MDFLLGPMPFGCHDLRKLPKQGRNHCDILAGSGEARGTVVVPHNLLLQLASPHVSSPTPGSLLGDFSLQLIMLLLEFVSRLLEFEQPRLQPVDWQFP